MTPPLTMSLRSMVLDCPDPPGLASFYAALLDGQLDDSDPDWCEVHVAGSAVKLAFQRVESYVAPQWPDGSPQQLHLDLTVSDLDAACRHAAALGAVALGDPVEEPHGVFVVHTDPVGHPFCLCADRYVAMAERPDDHDHRPDVAVENSQAGAAVTEFAAGLQAGHDQRDADLLNRQFAGDVVWGSPYGALVEGYEQLHPIHVGFQSHEGERPRARYEVRHQLAISNDVAIAHIARLILGPDDQPLPPSSDGGQLLSELAMYVLVRREGRWWLAAGQHTPMKPGGALPAQV